MTTPKDIIPTRYEVVKLKTGVEIVGMTRDMGDRVEITLPMICQLSLIPGTPRTQATFHPYSALSSDMKVQIPLDSVMHRNNMNEQFISHYDDASSRWFEMIENKSIPLATVEDKKVSEIMRRSIDRMMSRMSEAPDEQFIEEQLEDMDWELEELEHAIAPGDKKKLH